MGWGEPKGDPKASTGARLEGGALPAHLGDGGRPMTYNELLAAGLADSNQTAPVSSDPDTTLEGTPFIHDHMNPDGSEQKPSLEVVDSFVLLVEYAQDRTPGEAPTFESYDEAREVGIGLLQNHADAWAFSISKRTSLQK